MQKREKADQIKNLIIECQDPDPQEIYLYSKMFYKDLIKSRKNKFNAEK